MDLGRSSSFIQGSHTTKNMASELLHFCLVENNFSPSRKIPEITSPGHQWWRLSTPSPPKEPPCNRPPHYKPEGTMAGRSTPSSTEEPPRSRPSYSGTRPPHCFFFFQSPFVVRVQSYLTLYIAGAYCKSLQPALQKTEFWTSLLVYLC